MIKFVVNGLMDNTYEYSLEQLQSIRVTPSDIIGVYVNAVWVSINNPNANDADIESAITAYMEYAEWYEKTTPIELFDPYGNVVGVRINGVDRFFGDE
jgi:hypothetical protein